MQYRVAWLDPRIERTTLTISGCKQHKKGSATRALQVRDRLQACVDRHSIVWGSVVNIDSAVRRKQVWVGTPLYTCHIANLAQVDADSQ